MINSNDWWGFCKLNSIGWVFLDRTINIPGQSELFFVNCKNSEIYKETKENWNNPNCYVYENRYFESLSSNEKEKAQTAVVEYKKHIEEYKKKLINYNELIKVERFKKTRQNYFTKLGIVNPGEAVDTGKIHRVSHCYNCKQKLDSNFQCQCKGCNWMICSLCGACGCGYSQ